MVDRYLEDGEKFEVLLEGEGGDFVVVDLPQVLELLTAKVSLWRPALEISTIQQQGEVVRERRVRNPRRRSPPRCGCGSCKRMVEGAPGLDPSLYRAGSRERADVFARLGLTEDKLGKEVYERKMASARLLLHPAHFSAPAVLTCAGCRRSEGDVVNDGPARVAFPKRRHRNACGPAAGAAARPRNAQWYALKTDDPVLHLPGTPPRGPIGLCKVCRKAFRRHYTLAADVAACPAHEPCAKCARILAEMAWVTCRGDGCDLQSVYPSSPHPWHDGWLCYRHRRRGIAATQPAHTLPGKHLNESPRGGVYAALAELCEQSPLKRERAEANQLRHASAAQPSGPAGGSMVPYAKHITAEVTRALHSTRFRRRLMTAGEAQERAEEAVAVAAGRRQEMVVGGRSDA